jgi:hypothetical protein
VLNNPNLPTMLFNDIMKEVNRVHNTADGEMIDRLETSAEYLKGVFDADDANHDDEETD